MPLLLLIGYTPKAWHRPYMPGGFDFDTSLTFTSVLFAYVRQAKKSESGVRASSYDVGKCQGTDATASGPYCAMHHI